MPQALSPHPLANAHLVPMSRWAGGFDGWTYRPTDNKGGWECFDGLLESNTPGAEASFDFSSPILGLYYRLGPESGDLLYSIDDADFQPLRVFDRFSPQFWRPQYRMLREDLPAKLHQLRLRVSDQRDPASKGNWVQLAHLMCG